MPTMNTIRSTSRNNGTAINPANSGVRNAEAVATVPLALGWTDGHGSCSLAVLNYKKEDKCAL